MKGESPKCLEVQHLTVLPNGNSPLHLGHGRQGEALAFHDLGQGLLAQCYQLITLCFPDDQDRSATRGVDLEVRSARSLELRRQMRPQHFDSEARVELADVPDLDALPVNRLAVASSAEAKQASCRRATACSSAA